MFWIFFRALSGLNDRRVKNAEGGQRQNTNIATEGSEGTEKRPKTN